MIDYHLHFVSVRLLVPSETLIIVVVVIIVIISSSRLIIMPCS